jgi:cytochrome b involved in lipid metabolism
MMLGPSQSFSTIRNARSVRSLVLFYQNSTASSRIEKIQVAETVERFQREAAKKKEVDEECVLTIHGNQYNMTAWANAHPGMCDILLSGTD